MKQCERLKKPILYVALLRMEFIDTVSDFFEQLSYHFCNFIACNY